MKSITSAIWAAGFLANLVSACGGTYKGQKPWFFGRKSGHPHGNVDATTASLMWLLSDTATEHAAKLQELKKLEGTPVPKNKAEKLQRELKLHTAKSELKALKNRCDSLRELAWAYTHGTHAAFKTVNIGGASVSEKGILFAEEDAEETPWALAQDHPVRQAGLHLVRIIAGDDRPAATGLPNGDLTALRTDEPVGSGHIKGGAVATVEDERLRRLMALASQIFEEDLGFPCTIRGMAEHFEKRARLASKAAELARTLFWQLLTDDEVRKWTEDGLVFELGSDWTITAKQRPKGGLLGFLESIGMPIDADDLAQAGVPGFLINGEGFDLIADGEDHDCGNPDCPIHGSGRRTETPRRQPSRNGSRRPVPAGAAG